MQAVLDRDHSYNYTGRGSGDLVSGVVEMDLPGDSAQLLTLATTIPEADPLQPLFNVPTPLREVYEGATEEGIVTGVATPETSLGSSESSSPTEEVCIGSSFYLV